MRRKVRVQLVHIHISFDESHFNVLVDKTLAVIKELAPAEARQILIDHVKH